MVSKSIIDSKPYVEKRNFLPVLPSHFTKIASKWIRDCLREECINKVIGFSFCPSANFIALKLKLNEGSKFLSFYITDCPIDILRLFWNINPDIDDGILFYLANSSDIAFQFKNNRTLDNIEHLIWFKNFGF